jgi:hypothetical protein
MELVFLAAIKTLLVMQAMHASVVGKVLDETTGEPLADAVVSLSDLHRATITDSGGYYELCDVPVGSHQISFRFIGYAPRKLSALVPPDGQLVVNASLRPEPIRLQSILVRAKVPTRAIGDDDAGVFPDREFMIAEVRNHPLPAEPDVFEAIAGGEVVLRSESPSGVHVRGGASDQTGYLLDGIPVFSPHHAAGIFSAWDSDALLRLHLSSSAPSPEYPDALSGTIVAVTRAPGQRLQTRGSISVTQAGVSADGPIGPSGAGYVVSVRKGFPGLVVAKDESSHLRGESGDGLAKLEAPALGGRIRLLAYDSSNEISAASTGTSAAEPGAESPRSRNAFEWYSRSFGAEWSRAYDHTTARVVGFRAVADASAEWAARAGRMDLTAARRDEGLRLSVERVGARAVTLAGVRIERSRTSYRIDSDSTLAPLRALGAHDVIATAFAEHTRNFGRRIEIRIGAALGALGDETRLGPRAQLRSRLSEHLSLSGSYARTHQYAQSLRNAESVVGNIFPVDLFVGAGGSGVPIARSDQGVLALEYRRPAGVRVGVQAYARGFDGLLLVAPREGEPFATDALTAGTGVARGVSVEAAVGGARFGFLASYGLQRVRFTHEGSTYVPEHGTSHLFEGGVSVYPTATSTVRVGIVGALGRRTTAISGGFEWEACNLLDGGCEFGGSPHYGAEPIGGVALPDYFRVDLGLRKEWRLRPGDRDARIGLFATITNLLGRTNVLTYAREPSTAERVAIEMRPRAPLVVGLDWRF